MKPLSIAIAFTILMWTITSSRCNGGITMLSVLAFVYVVRAINKEKGDY